jgi:hypothetical protein
MIFRWRALLVTLVALAAGGAVAALSASGSTGSRPSLRSAPRAHSVTGIAPSLRRHFALFRSKARHRARSAASSSTQPAPAVLNWFQSQYGLDLSQAQTVQLTPSFAVTVYPGSSGACMNWRNADGISGTWVCDLSADADAGELKGDVATTPHGADHEVFGLVPNGDATVVVEDASGTDQTVPVRNNMFIADVGSSGHWTLKVGAAGAGVQGAAAGGVQSWYGMITPGG